VGAGALMYAVRLWSVRHAAFWETFYRRFEAALVAAGPALKRIGFARLEAPVAAVESNVKGLLFDCQMCGRCVLSSTGMSCPMNCPKQMRNGPCGGVRANGHCEVRPEMRCVWVQAWEGSRRMSEGDRITELQPPVDHRRKGTSAWLRVVRERLGEAA
jgi:Methylene-tetrahydrofolate reductase C terminal